METRTAGGMTWPASHCPLLGRVIPSTTDVSSVAKESTGAGGEGEEERKRQRKRSCVNFLFFEGMAFYSRKTFCPTNGPWRSTPDWWRVQILALPLSHPMSLGLRALQVSSMESRPDPNCNVLEFMG